MYTVLGYCHSRLFHNIASKDIAKRQRIQNYLAKIVVSQSPRVSRSVPLLLLSATPRSVPLLQSLHWLPVRFCIMFKICGIYFLTTIIAENIITVRHHLKPYLFNLTCNFLAHSSNWQWPLHCPWQWQCLIHWFCCATELRLWGYWHHRIYLLLLVQHTPHTHILPYM